MNLIILLTMDITPEYEEYSFLFNRSHFFVFQGCKAVFVKKLIINIKNITNHAVFGRQQYF